MPAAVSDAQAAAVLGAAAPFQNGYLAAALARMTDAVAAAFPGGARALPTSAELQKCIGRAAAYSECIKPLIISSTSRPAGNTCIVLCLGKKHPAGSGGLATAAARLPAPQSMLGVPAHPTALCAPWRLFACLAPGEGACWLPQTGVWGHCVGPSGTSAEGVAVWPGGCTRS